MVEGCAALDSRSPVETIVRRERLGYDGVIMNVHCATRLHGTGGGRQFNGTSNVVSRFGSWERNRSTDSPLLSGFWSKTFGTNLTD